MKYYLESERDGVTASGKPRYKYLVECRVCHKQYWRRAWPKSEVRCPSCAGKQGYTPAKIERSDARKRGDGYITKQGYHLIYDGNRYVPAHRLAFPDIPDDYVVHHIDGDKLNNEMDNLVPLTKRDHRKAHGSLEKISYLLIQAGLISYDRDTNRYNMEKDLEDIILNSDIKQYNYESGRQENFPVTYDYIEESLKGE